MPESLGQYVSSVRAYALPEELFAHLPVNRLAVEPRWSAFSAVLPHRTRWSETGLRRALNAKIAELGRSRGQPEDKKVLRVHVPKPQGDHPAALVAQYLQVN